MQHWQHRYWRWWSSLSKCRHDAVSEKNRVQQYRSWLDRALGFWWRWKETRYGRWHWFRKFEWVIGHVTFFESVFISFKVSMQRMRTENVGQRRRRQTKKKLKNLEDDKEKNKKLVDCLYIGLMCADCPCVIMWSTCRSDTEFKKLSSELLQLLSVSFIFLIFIPFIAITLSGLSIHSFLFNRQ